MTIASIAGLSLSEIQALIATEKRPPLYLWNPPDCGQSAIRILADGRWLHEGNPINRAELVQLFASILRRDSDGQYWVVTPVERQSVEVEDAAFIAVELAVHGARADQVLAFRLNIGSAVIAGPDNPIRVGQGNTGPKPYLHVRGDLTHPIEARIARAVYYELAELAVPHPESGALGVWSSGAFFALEASE
jgi:uncharacterized protein